MIKHIVIWRLKEQAHGNDRATNARLIKAQLEALVGQVPGLLAVEVGIDFSATDTSGDVVLVSDFESRAALEGYQHHPAHVAVAGFIGEARSERRMVDYEA
ncbi:MAG: Dabb family protein [Leptothrix sp. (in: b-proteobacteria)]